MINQSTLPTWQRQLIWQGIKRHRPGLAELLKNDANIVRLKEKFSASVVLSNEEIAGYMEAGAHVRGH